MSSLLKQTSRIAAAAVLLAAVWFALLYKGAPPPDPYGEKPPGPRVLARDGKLLRGFLSPDEKWRLRIPLERMSGTLVKTVVEYEDRRFRSHPGIDPIAVIRALRTNLAAGKVVTGASTISMQLARLMEPHDRSIGGKLRQAFRALQYETLYSKDRILEMYLNLAPYGGNVEGVGAASYIYFDKPASDLSLAEASLLAVLPQSPAARHPTRHPEKAKEARDRLIRALVRRGLIDEEDALEATGMEIPARTFSVPFDAPHFSEWALGKREGAASIGTTIDAAVQERAESLLRSWALSLRPAGIGQAAAVIVDYERSELIAMVGSASFHDSLYQGEVNGALARRSPGSTLKPFVYTLAFDRGVTAPASLVEDLPVWFGSYRPENYDGTFRGTLTAAEALQSSRNVPAVALAAELGRSGRDGIYELLRAAGVSSLDRGRDHYGLSLVLGGCDITLLELAGLYADIARQGEHHPIHLFADHPECEGGVRLFSREAAYLTLRALTDVVRPEGNDLWRSGRERIPIPWKTGTSYGHRDAWSVGIAGNYVVAVWIGNFDGAGVPPLVGRDVAGPLLFALIETLPREEAGSWHRPPPGIRSREVCAVSGAPRNGHCPERKEALFIPGVSPSKECAVHRRIEIDRETGASVCSRCRGGRSVEGRLVEWWPSAVSAHRRQTGLDVAAVPPHEPSCPMFGADHRPVIVSPQSGMEYHIRRGIPLDDQKIALVASAGRGSGGMYWFVDGELAAVVGPDETAFLRPVPGSHRLSVEDDAGRSASAEFTVVGTAPAH